MADEQLKPCVRTACLTLYIEITVEEAEHNGPRGFDPASQRNKNNKMEERKKKLGRNFQVKNA